MRILRAPTDGFDAAPFAGPEPLAALQEPATLWRSGSFEARVTRRKSDVRKAQRLRYEVFYEEGGAEPDRMAALIRRDVCAYDRHCDHLIVFDHDALSSFGRGKPRAVGACRLLSQQAARGPGFYSACEFDVASLTSRHPDKRFLEVGRSCVLPQYRSKRVVDVLWRALHVYVRRNRADVLFGCASLPGADPRALATELSFLHHFARAREEWRALALPQRFVSMNLVEKSVISPRRAFARLPPLLKGYLRLGAQVGEGAVIDRAFGATDVLVVMPVAEFDARYLAHFSFEEAAVGRPS